MRYYYIIEETANEYSSLKKYIAESFEDARAHVKDYTNWYCPKGSCTIIKVDENFHELMRWDYYDNKFRPGMYDWEAKEDKDY